LVKRWVKYVVGMEGREIFRVFVGKPEGNKPIGRIW
jgi:hypothetical protein